MRETPKNQDLTGNLLANFLLYQIPKVIPGSIRTFWYKRFAQNNEKCKVQKKAYMSQKQQPTTQRLICLKSKYYISNI